MCYPWNWLLLTMWCHCTLTICQPLLHLIRASPHLKAAVPIVSANHPRPIGRYHRCASLDNCSDYAMYSMCKDPILQEGFWLDGGEIHPHLYVSSVSFCSRLLFLLFYLATGHQNIATQACAHIHALSFPLSWPPWLTYSVLVLYIKPLAWLWPGRLSYPILSNPIIESIES